MTRALKIISSACAVLMILCLIGEYPYSYFLGSLRPSLWQFFNPISDFLHIIIIFAVLLVTWTISLSTRKAKHWTTVIVVGFLICIALDYFALPRPGTLMVNGIRDHVMEVCTLDDLRRFARTVHTDMPDIDVVRIDPTALTGQRAADYQKMEKTYPFLSWGLGQGARPYIKEDDGTVNVLWGGALLGAWGFSVSIDGSKNDSGHEMRILRLSDDIYFFHGG